MPKASLSTDVTKEVFVKLSIRNICNYLNRVVDLNSCITDCYIRFFFFQFHVNGNFHVTEMESCLASSQGIALPYPCKC